MKMSTFLEILKDYVDVTKRYRPGQEEEADKGRKFCTDERVKAVLNRGH